MAQLEALEERRVIEVRHARFNSALVASVLINANRSADSESVSPFDFLAGFETVETEKEKLRKSVKHAVRVAFVQMREKTPEELQIEKRKMISRMAENGIDDPEGLIREVFPDL